MSAALSSFTGPPASSPDREDRTQRLMIRKTAGSDTEMNRQMRPGSVAISVLNL